MWGWGWCSSGNDGGDSGYHSQEAIEHYKKAVELAPDSVAAYNNWGRALDSLSNHTEAIEYFSKAAELDPFNGTVFANWGFSLYSMGKFSAAAEKFQLATKLRPTPNIYNCWGKVLHLLGRYDRCRVVSSTFFDHQHHSLSFA